MKPVTQEMLESAIKALHKTNELDKQKELVNEELGKPCESENTTIDETTLALMGKLQSPAESPAEIAKLTSALALLSSDVGYGSGRFYDSSESPESDYWLAGIWAIGSLNWQSGKDIAR